MSVAHDHLKRPTDEAAMARVLAAERDARAAIEETARGAQRLREDARLRAKAIAAAAARRVAAVRGAMERRLAQSLERIATLEREALAAGDLEPSDHRRLERAIERHAAELSSGEP